MEKRQNNVVSASLLIGVLLATLLGGLALVLRSLRNINLRLFLQLKKDDSATKKY